MYAHHPRFRGVRRAFESRSAPVEGGDVLLLAPGGGRRGGADHTGGRAESLVRSLFDDQLAHTVLAVAIGRGREQMHLDTICTMVDTDAVVMNPDIADSLTAVTVHRSQAGLDISAERPFVAAAAEAMGIPELRVIGTGLDPVIAGREQLGRRQQHPRAGPGVVVAYERNAQTNARAWRIRVSRCCGSRRRSWRPVGSGPRGMSCPIARDAL